MQDHQVLLVLPAMQAQMDKLVNPVPKDPKVLLVRLVAMVNQVPPVHPVHQVHPARKVFVRNIALWMAAFSSRMARGDKYFFTIPIFPHLLATINFYSVYRQSRFFGLFFKKMPWLKRFFLNITNLENYAGFFNFF